MIKPLLIPLAFGLLYALLFSSFEWGLNVLAFDAALVGALFATRRELFVNPRFRLAVGALFVAALSVVIVHGGWSFFAHHLSLLLVLGYAQARELRFVWFGLLLGVRSLLAGPVRWLRGVMEPVAVERETRPSPRLAYWAKQAALPALLLVPFAWIYAAGNARFSALLTGTAHWLGEVMDVVSMRHVPLFFLGTLLTLPLFLPSRRRNWWVRYQATFRDVLTRRGVRPRVAGRPITLFGSPVFKPGKGGKTRPPFTTLALRHEYRRALLTFGGLNVLLLIVNLIDLRFVWFNPGAATAAELSQYVHAGTYNLLLSVFLAMVVVVWFFRARLNFLATNGPLLVLARIWLVQNAVLIGSVGLRNVWYIQQYGLAMGRVFVVVGLALTAFGLWSLWRKLSRRSTLAYLLHVNGLALWVAVLLLGVVNWSGVITRYNLAVPAREGIDWRYLRDELDDRNTFLLVSHPSPVNNYRFSPARYERTFWGWNYADHRVLKTLTD